MLDPVVSLFLNGQIKNEDKSPDHTGGPVGCASVIPQSEKPPVQFPVRVHAWVAFEFLARVQGNQSLFLSLSFSLPSPL